jgi:hypothetical protein
VRAIPKEVNGAASGLAFLIPAGREIGHLSGTLSRGSDIFGTRSSRGSRERRRVGDPSPRPEASARRAPQEAAQDGPGLAGIPVVGCLLTVDASESVLLPGAGLVDFAVIPHLDHADHPDASLANAARWAARIPAPTYAIDDETAIKVVDGTPQVVSEGSWKLFQP